MEDTLTDIKNAHIAILATHGFEKSELFEPKRQLEAAGAKVSVISPETGSIKSWDQDNWGESVNVDMALDEARATDFDALVLPGGQINPDRLRGNETAVRFVREFFDSGKTLAAICHAPWLLVEADVVRDRDVTSYHTIRTDLENAGGRWRDEPVVVHNALITSRKPADLDAFCGKIVEEVREGRHQRKAA